MRNPSRRNAARGRTDREYAKKTLRIIGKSNLSQSRRVRGEDLFIENKSQFFFFRPHPQPFSSKLEKGA
jgi:hypothetical protein